MAMDYRALQKEIMECAECAPLIVTNEMPKDSDYAAKDSAIAGWISASRQKAVEPRLVGSVVDIIDRALAGGLQYAGKVQIAAENTAPKASGPMTTETSGLVAGPVRRARHNKGEANETH